MDSNQTEKTQDLADDREAFIRELKVAFTEVPKVLKKFLTDPIGSIRNQPFSLIPLMVTFVVVHLGQTFFSLAFVHLLLSSRVSLLSLDQIATSFLTSLISPVLSSACFYTYLLLRQGSARIDQVASLVLSSSLILSVYMLPFHLIYIVHLNLPVLYLHSLLYLVVQVYLLFEGLTGLFTLPSRESLMVASFVSLLFIGVAG